MQTNGTEQSPETDPCIYSHSSVKAPGTHTGVKDGIFPKRNVKNCKLRTEK